MTTLSGEAFQILKYPPPRTKITRKQAPVNTRKGLCLAIIDRAREQDVELAPLFDSSGEGVST